MHTRVRILLVASSLLAALPAAAQTTISVTLEPAGDVSGSTVNDVVYYHHWGTVVYAGSSVGTFMMRREAANLGGAAAPQNFPSQSISIWIRLAGTNETLIMQGAIAPDEDGTDFVYVGGVTVAPPSVEFLRNAAFRLTSVPLNGIQQGTLVFHY